MRIRRVLLAIRLFDRLRDQSSVSIDVCKPGASPTACLGRLGTPVCAVVPLMLLLTAFDSAALAQSGSAAQPAISRNAHLFAGFINEASQRFAIAPNWIRSVQSIESAGDVHARSPKGAMGLMQIMPATWAELRERYNLGNDPYDPHDNILAGTAYLRELLDRYGSPGVFAAYNAGPSRYEEHLAGGSLPRRKACKAACHRTAADVDVQRTIISSCDAIRHAIRSHESARSDAGAHAVERCHDRNLCA